MLLAELVMLLLEVLMTLLEQLLLLREKLLEKLLLELETYNNILV